MKSMKPLSIVLLLSVAGAQAGYLDDIKQAAQNAADFASTNASAAYNAAAGAASSASSSLQSSVSQAGQAISSASSSAGQFCQGAVEAGRTFVSSNPNIAIGSGAGLTAAALAAVGYGAYRYTRPAVTAKPAAPATADAQSSDLPKENEAAQQVASEAVQAAQVATETARAEQAPAVVSSSSDSSSTVLASVPVVATAPALTELDLKLIADLHDSAKGGFERASVDWRYDFGVTELSPAVVAELAKMPKLTQLMIGNPDLKKANLNNLTQLPDLSGLTKLQVLGVMNNNLTSISALPASLKTTLNVDGNRLPAAEVARLQGLGVKNLWVKNQRA